MFLRLESLVVMRKLYKDSKLKFYIGDVRDYNSIYSAMRGADYVFHAAALKQVPSCEFYPIQAVQTNILGTENMLNAAIQNKVKKVICLSTDKAVYPINAMGMSKALMEKTFIAKARVEAGSDTVICGTRYGNVMASRGSVIPLFLEQIKAGKEITITDPDMTRFMMSLDEAVELVLYAFEHGKNGEIFVQKSPAATIETLARAVIEVVNKPDHPVHIIGTRHGEKLYETLLTREEMVNANDEGNYYRIMPDNRDLNYNKFFDKGTEAFKESVEYHSHNTKRLDVKEMKELLLNLREIEDDLP
jgi:UDP-N-acetylglucosamine 4,6-dehydratase